MMTASPSFAALAAASALVLTACAGPVPMTAAADAESIGCAELAVRLPDVVAEQVRRDTTAQATGAWGDPASVLLWCGESAPGPTTDSCVSVNGIDWIVDESDAPRYRFTSYGRQPTVSVVVDNELVSGSTVLSDLASAVSVTERVGECLNPSDVQ